MQSNENALTGYIGDVDAEEDDLRGSVFACCHLYRECSDQKRCLCDDEIRASQCAYRKNLDAGNILYGKHAKGFDEVRYQECLRKIDSLSKCAKDAFERLVTDFCGIHRGVGQVIVRSKHIEELDSIGLFKFETLGSQILDLCTYEALYAKLKKQNPDAAEAYRLEKNAYRKEHKGKGVEQRIFRIWMNGPGLEYRDALAAPYRLALPLGEAKVFIEELWRRRYFAAWKYRYWWLSPLAVDGLLNSNTVVCEIERIVSIVKKDYSQNEKKEISDMLKIGGVVGKKINVFK